MERDIPIYDPTSVEIPEAVTLAAQEGCLSFFIGNGLSRLFKIPSWDDLVNRMLEELAKNGVINHSDASLLKEQPLKVKFSIADHYFKRNSHEKNSNPKEGLSYKKMLSIPNGSEKKSIFRLLAKCGVKFITTNYDTLLDEALVERFRTKSDFNTPEEIDNLEPQIVDSIEVINKEKEFLIFSHPSELRSIAQIEQNVLLHLHGSIASPESERKIIASTADYLGLYTDEKLMDKVRDLLKEQTIVFLGYGLDELEILELVLRSAAIVDNQADSQQQFFLLLPVLSHQAPILKHLSIYWEEQLGIKILAYNIDKKGYDSIEEVIETWSAVLSKRSKAPPRVKHVNLMDDLMSRFDGAVE
ncbi:MAG: hypothetical protein A2504_16960 [Bdellovibrionales bacterium RIFOXYD12_FULL_39_22]|nr:MAG: hypothetical protein A2385_05900 [Bdellovibrionales bacterium RIFOXYB1_FULL_39_21]OFZ41486.1 MAG: hypothetical protein A2485_04650 [Bdellovibrionales bacterium RIFOXYC12_FULL_39_17]OFZ50388.1 MAG: hypothetical protein A2404_02480 [Bdellovibrionales bacterium RIFOXYC1_FULL_39_130]OFZ71314.1 MAG: hypothetical protein A2451_10205 [Bdellovibrionales bacterium RIFOXYC2_FULL_39_8]OFZ77667.1 MAG: hypothetical protein A2560_16555 [Bdellovibrionales bacterium RIFOXYD1_FULL_39_84]OFZ92206.1 MAG: